MLREIEGIKIKELKNGEVCCCFGGTFCIKYPEISEKMVSEKEKKETVYDRIEKLEDEIATLRNEIDVIKHALRNKLARHEITMIKKGQDVSSIIDN